MSLGTLWTIPKQDKGKRIRAAAAFVGIKLDLPEHYVHYEDNKKPEFLSKFPLGKIPALDEADGFKVFETTAIARYIASLAPNSTLLGSSPKDAALIDQWISVADNEIGNYDRIVNQLTRGLIPYSKSLHTTMVERAVRGLKTLEQHLATHTYFVTERITLADISVASVIQRLALGLIDPALRKQLPNVVRHAETVVNHPLMKDVFGPIEWCEQAAQFVPPKKQK